MRWHVANFQTIQVLDAKICIFIASGLILSGFMKIFTIKTTGLNVNCCLSGKLRKLKRIFTMSKDSYIRFVKAIKGMVFVILNKSFL